MTKQRNDPRISVNKLAQYVTSRAGRQNQILRNAKFPPDYITTYYREAGDAIARFLASGMTELAILERASNSLSQMEPTNIYETRRIDGNLDAIDTFSAMLDDIEFGGAEAKLGANHAPHLVIANVSISVRPEVTLHSKSKTASLVGGIKLHFPKTEPLDEEQAGYVSAMMHSFCEAHLWKEGSPFPGHCMVIDIASRLSWSEIYQAATKRHSKRLRSNCIFVADNHEVSATGLDFRRS